MLPTHKPIAHPVPVVMLTFSARLIFPTSCAALEYDVDHEDDDPPGAGDCSGYGIRDNVVRLIHTSGVPRRRLTIFGHRLRFVDIGSSPGQQEYKNRSYYQSEGDALPVFPPLIKLTRNREPIRYIQF